MKKVTKDEFCTVIKKMTTKHGKIIMMQLDYEPNVEGSAAVSTPVCYEKFHIVGMVQPSFCEGNVIIKFNDGYTVEGTIDFTGCYAKIVKYFYNASHKKARFYSVSLDETGRCHKFGTRYCFRYSL